MKRDTMKRKTGPAGGAPGLGMLIVGGLALGVYALFAFDGTTLVMVALSGAEIFGAGLMNR